MLYRKAVGGALLHAKSNRGTLNDDKLREKQREHYNVREADRSDHDDAINFGFERKCSRQLICYEDAKIPTRSKSWREAGLS